MLLDIAVFHHIQRINVEQPQLMVGFLGEFCGSRLWHDLCLLSDQRPTDGPRFLLIYL